MKEERPWGNFEVLAENEVEGWKVKRIEVNPESRLSLQYHTKREETWTVVSGRGHVTKDNSDGLPIFVAAGSHIFIKRGEMHRVETDTDSLVFIEVQQGTCDEDDIVRIEDDYGRCGESVT